jgi:hypothetical protein
MIASIVIGSGNNRTVVERQRNAEHSRYCRDGIIRRLGLRWPKKGS